MANLFANKRFQKPEFDELQALLTEALHGTYGVIRPQGTELDIVLAESPRTGIRLSDQSTGIVGRLEMVGLHYMRWSELPAFCLDYKRTPREVADVVLNEMLPACEQYVAAHREAVLEALAKDEAAKKSFAELAALAGAENVDSYWSEAIPDDMRGKFETWAVFGSHVLLRDKRDGEVALLARNLDQATATRLIAVLTETAQPVGT